MLMVVEWCSSRSRMALAITGSANTEVVKEDETLFCVGCV
jgi:hypothetical protein